MTTYETEDFVNDDDTDCEHCGSYTTWEDCPYCGGEGGLDGDELMMEDPMWYGPDDYRKCEHCEGKGGWHLCTNQNCKQEEKTIQNPNT